MYIISIDADACDGCGQCAENCPVNLLSMEGSKAVVTGEPTECMGCEACTSVCPEGACHIQEI